MKKGIFGLVLLLSFSFGAHLEAAPRYWEQYLRSIAEKYNRLDLIPRYSARATQRNKTRSVRFSLPRRSSRSVSNPSSKKFLGNSRTPSSPSTRRTTSSRNVHSGRELRASVRPIRSGKNVEKLTTDPIDVFEISFANKNPRTSTRFYDPLYVDEMKFSLIDNSGITENFQDFLLSVEDNDFRFEKDGSVTLKFGNLRLASGDVNSIRVAIRVDDPQNMPHRSGSMRVRLDGATGRTERSGATFSLPLSGTRVSSLIAFDPVPESYGTPTFSGGLDIDIHGKMLTSGQSELVLATGLRANSDDLLIQEITLHDTIGTNGVDVFIDQVQALDVDSGAVLGTTRFINGRARFRFSKRIFVSRSREKRIAFKVFLEDRIPPSFLNTRFRLNIDPADVKVQSYSTGRYLADSNKHFSIENETFTVTDTMLRVSSPGQVDALFIGAGHQLVHRVTLEANGRRDAELARVSFQVSANNVAFPGGISADDFDLVRIVGNQQRPLQTSATLSGSVVRFDLSNPLSVYEGSPVTLGLRIALENKASTNDSDGVVIKNLGDTSLVSGSLSAVRGTNPNFIWSDVSASPHSASSQDWSNGYLLPGIPSQTFSYKRGY